jgi:Inorganic H+ pyrophosphatase
VEEHGIILKKVLKVNNCLIKENGIPVNQIEEIKIKLNELNSRREKGKSVSQEEIKALEEQYKELLEKPHNDQDILYMKSYKGEKIKMYKKAEKASIVGDTVGDPMKDTSGPSLNILIKLSSIISVVFGTLFLETSYLVK